MCDCIHVMEYLYNDSFLHTNRTKSVNVIAFENPCESSQVRWGLRDYQRKTETREERSWVLVTSSSVVADSAVTGRIEPDSVAVAAVHTCSVHCHTWEAVEVRTVVASSTWEEEQVQEVRQSQLDQSFQHRVDDSFALGAAYFPVQSR